MRSMNRRDAFTSLFAAPALVAVAAVGFATPETLTAEPRKKPPVTPEARLIALCEEFIQLEHQVNAVHQTLDTFEQEEAAQPRLKALYAQEKQKFEQINAIRATTLAGFTAKARAFAAWDRGEYLSKDSGNWDIAMLGQMVQELIDLAPKDGIGTLCPTVG